MARDKREETHKKRVLAFLAALGAGIALVIIWVILAGYVRNMGSSHWIKGGSGKTYTPGGAAKKLFDWFSD